MYNLTRICIIPFPLFGMVVWEYGAAEICVDVTGNV